MNRKGKVHVSVAGTISIILGALFWLGVAIIHVLERRGTDDYTILLAILAMLVYVYAYGAPLIGTFLGIYDIIRRPEGFALGFIGAFLCIAATLYVIFLTITTFGVHD